MTYKTRTTSSDSVNLGSNPSSPATANADVSGVSRVLYGAEQPEISEQTADTGRTNVGTAEVTRRGALDMQVCVPADWTDAEVIAFAGRENPCGTENGWFIRKAGDNALAGDPERQPCSSRAGCVHIMLDA